MSDKPQDPFTSLMEGMVALHEAYTSAIQAGFTEAQAMQIVDSMIRNSMRPPS